MKPAFSYYGGKQRLAKRIIELIPRHTVYVEPFAGGAAVFFAKPRPDVGASNYREVLNDLDGRITNFYHVLRDQPDELIRACALTPYSREEKETILEDPNQSDVENARRTLVQIVQSFANARTGWATSVCTRNHPASWTNLLARMYACADRLSEVYVENDDALEVIRRWDSPQSFFYCDPPYPGTKQNYSFNFSENDFLNLVSTLNGCQGSYILSCYDFDGSPIPEKADKFCNDAKVFNRVVRGLKNRTRSVVLPGKERVEILWRRFARTIPRNEIVKLYNTGKFDCFCSEPLRKPRRKVLAHRPRRKRLAR
jgi:DNA adenine methylase